MANIWNPNSPTTLGLEWLVDSTPGSYVLDAASKAFGQYFPGQASGLQCGSIAAYALAVSGTGKFGGEIYSTPLAVPPAAQYDTNYFGSDTSKDFRSMANGGDAWVTNSGAAATYTAVSPGVDDTTYLKNVNSWEAGYAIMALRGANATQTAGKRILSVEVHVRLKVTSTNNAGIGMLGVLVLGGGVNRYDGIWVQSQYNNGYQDYVLGTWTYNPSTGVPWTLADLNNIITTGGTDRFGFISQWGGLVADSIRVSSVYLKVKWVPEDRIGYAYGDVSTTGWQTLTAKSTPNLITKQDSNLDVNTGNTGSWTANANTTATNDATNKGGSWTRSLKMLAGAAGTFGATSGLYYCTPGKTYSAACYTNVTAAKLTTIAIQFVDVNGTTISTFTSSSISGAGAFQAGPKLTGALAPSNAYQMRVIIQTTATAGAQTCFASNVILALDQIASALVYDAGIYGAGSKIDGAAEVSYAVRGVPDYVVLRRISGTGTMSIPSLPAGSSPGGNPSGFVSYPVTLQDSGGAILAVGAQSTAVTAMVGNDRTSGPLYMTYVQPYAARVPGQVDLSNTVKAQITLPVATFAQVRFVVAAAQEIPQAALNIKLKRTSDNAQAGGTAVINPTDLTQVVPTTGGGASRTTPQIYTAVFPSTGANTAAQYYVEFSSGALTGQGWYVYCLDDMGYTNGGNSLDSLTFGQGTDGWIDPLNGGTQTRRNGMVTVQTIPTAPGSFTVAVV